MTFSKPFPLITRYIKWFFLISAIVLIPGIYSLMRFGLRPSIDFTGGTILEVTLSAERAGEVTQEKVGAAIKGITSVTQIQKSNQSLSLRLPPTDLKQKKDILEQLKKLDPKLVEKRYEVVGPLLGQELIAKTGLAIAFSVVAIALYLAIRFTSLQYGISAAVSTIHDALVIGGIFSLLGHIAGVEVDLLFVTAVLTILSFSVHDTIIVFDRIREQVKNKSERPFEDLVNTAAIETLNRSLRNSLAIIFMLLTVFLLTEGSLHWFVLALLIGTITGTYSSTCVALPLLVLWQRRKNLRG